MDSNGTVGSVNGINSNEFYPGMSVKGVKDNGCPFEGEVLNFNRESGWLVIQQQSKKNADKIDVTMLTLKTLKDISVMKGSSRQELLPDLCVSKMRSRRDRNIELMKKSNRNVATECVSDHAQHLFDFIAKTITDISWHKQDIVVMKSVVISPPYEAAHMRSDSSGDSETTLSKALQCVSKLMDKFSERDAPRRSVDSAPSSGSSSSLHVAPVDIRVGGD